jgi:antitoxin component of MazEF toxin-antitoxin module
MPTQKLVNKNIRKLIKLAGKSIVVSLPIEYVATLKWKAGQKVLVTKKGKHLIIKDWR